MDKSSRPYSCICSTIDDYFRQNEISYVKAAKALNVSPSAVSLQLSGNKPFGKNAAEKWHKAFNFSLEFLLFGTGSLFTGADESPINDAVDTKVKWERNNPFRHPKASFIRNIIAIITSSDNVFLLAAFDILYEKGEQAELSNLLRLAQAKERCDELAHVILGEMGFIGDVVTPQYALTQNIEDIRKEYRELREKVAKEMEELHPQTEESWTE